MFKVMDFYGTEQQLVSLKCANFVVFCVAQFTQPVSLWREWGHLIVVVIFITARRYACAVYAVVVCLWLSCFWCYTWST